MPVLNYADALRHGELVVDAAHLDLHRVYPLPLPRLDTTMGQVTTPDLPIDTLVADTRWTAKVTIVDPESSDLQTMSAKRQSSGAQLGWHFRIGTGSLSLLLPDPTGTGVLSPNLGSVTALPRDVPVYLRADVTATIPAGVDVRGYWSLDGLTWTPTGNAVHYASTFPFYDSTWLVRIGTYGGGTVFYKGKIFATDMVAINRAQLLLPGVAGNYLSVPDAANLNITGDIEIVARLALTDWTPALTSSVVSRQASGWVAYSLRVNPSGTLGFMGSTTGTSHDIAPGSTTPPGFADGATGWVKATRVAATGVVTFYWAPDQPTEPTTWTALTTTGAQPAGALYTPTIFPQTEIGARNGGQVEPLAGRIARVIVRDMIGTAPQLVFPGAAGNYLSVPDAANLDITDDLEIVVRAAPTTWRPAAQQVFAAKYVATGNQRSYSFALGASGQLVLTLSSAGTATTQAVSASGVASGSGMLWLKMTRVRSTGEVRFYTAPDAASEPTAWTALGGPITTAGTDAIFVGTAPAEIGSIAGGTVQNFQGRIARSIIRNGVGGTVVLDVNESNLTTGWQTSFAATTGQTVSEVGNVIRGRVLDVSENDASRATAPTANFLNGYGSTSGNTLTTPDAPDLNVTGDIRVTARVRDDSAETPLGSRYWGFKAVGPDDYGYSLLATYSNSQYATQGWPTGQATPSASTILGTRTVFGTTPPGADVWLRADVLGVNPATQALTQTARGYTSTDGSTWVPTGGNPTPVRADAMTRDAAAVLRLGYVTQGRLYEMQVETINRAQLIFPGVPGNYLTTPDAAPLDITGPIEIVVRAACQWQSATTSSWLVAKADAGNQRAYALLMEGTYPGRVRLLRSPDGSSISQTATATTALPFANGQMGWVKATHDATGTTRFYTAPDAGSNVEPTVWTQHGGDRPTYTQPTFSSTAPLTIGDASVPPPGAFPSQMQGRIARVIIRNGIAGPVVFDMDENNAGTMGAATTFPATSGQTMTRVSTSLALYPIVTPQVPALVWRFDGNEATTNGLSFTDARGRVWTLNNAGTIVRARTFPATSGQTVTAYSSPGSTDLVAPQAPATLWRFDASEWPPHSTAFADPRGRAWTATNGDTVAHPASEPDAVAT